MFGLGTVGTGVFKILENHAAQIEQKTGVRLVLKKICVQSPAKRRALKVPRHLLTGRPRDILDDDSISIVIELIGGIHPAKEILLEAMRKGKHVVTANKALLAEQGGVIFRAAAVHARRLGIEASVCGGIPIIKALSEGLVSNRVSHVLGIVNGTCNSILTAMSERGVDFREALQEAQANGYAEKNPRLDIDGIDSAHKLAVLARLAFRCEVPFGSIAVEGIRSLAKADIGYARELGYEIKLLAIGKRTGGGLELRVHPTLLPLDHPLANVRGVYNAVFVHADQAGDLLFYGKGAGSLPTASAVLSDVMDIVKKMGAPAAGPFSRTGKLTRLAVCPMENVASKYYLRFQVVDKPGVLGRIARTLGRHRISILSVHQKESHDPRSTPVIILTYQAHERDVRNALKAIDRMREISEKTTVIRVEK